MLYNSQISMNPYPKLVLNIIRNRLTHLIAFNYSPEISANELVSKVIASNRRFHYRPLFSLSKDGNVDLMTHCLNVVVPVELKIAADSQLIGNYDRNYKIWETVFRLQNFLRDNQQSYGIVIYIAKDNVTNKINTFAPLIDGEDETRMIKKIDGTFSYVGKHTIKWHKLKNDYQMCVITLVNQEK